jgi:hypothetical protein
MLLRAGSVARLTIEEVFSVVLESYFAMQSLTDSRGDKNSSTYVFTFDLSNSAQHILDWIDFFKLFLRKKLKFSRSAGRGAETSRLARERAAEMQK